MSAHRSLDIAATCGRNVAIVWGLVMSLVRFARRWAQVSPENKNINEKLKHF